VRIETSDLPDGASELTATDWHDGQIAHCGGCSSSTPAGNDLCCVKAGKIERSIPSAAGREVLHQ
jgi:hypothetical protein